MAQTALIGIGGRKLGVRIGIAPLLGLEMALDNDAKVVFLYAMNVATASDTNRDTQNQPRQMIRRQMQEWFQWMDHVLDVHRSTFVFREATEAQLEEHKTALKLAIRCCLIINGLIADPDSNSPDLAARLQVRIRQLQDAYDTFHDASLSDEQAGKILKQVFPE